MRLLLIPTMLFFNGHRTMVQAIEHLRAFEKKDQHLKAMAATNLAFIYFLEGENSHSPGNGNLCEHESSRYIARSRGLATAAAVTWIETAPQLELDMWI